MNVRKDSSAGQTVSTIQAILNRLKIKTSNTETIVESDGWASYRLELEEAPGIGTNGKGLTKEYAAASAHAEFMERLSSLHLVHNYYPQMDSMQMNADATSPERLLRSLSTIEHPLYTLPSHLLDTVISKKVYQNLAPYYDVTSDFIVDLPQWFIEANCGSNGLCAGNSPEEAILQGLNEIQERYARKLYFEGMSIVRSIPDDDLISLPSWKMIEAIRKLGFYCVVKDFTCNGQYPVLGVLLADNEREHYLVSLGADYNIDICLQRCITELFQGRKIDLWFKLHLNETYEKSSFYANCVSQEATHCYQKNIANNTGNYPLTIFDSTICNGRYQQAFVSNLATNKDLLLYALHMLQNTKHKIFIRDYSHLGFPVFRVFIPGMSEISNLAMCILENKAHFDDFLTLYHNPCNLSKDNVERFTSAVEKLRSLPFFKVNNLIVAASNIPLLGDRHQIGLDNIDVLVSLLNFRVSNYKEAYEYYRKYIDEKKYTFARVSPKEHALLVVFKFFQDGFGWEEAEPVLETLKCSNVKDLLSCESDLFLDLPRCPNCDSCKVSKCYYNTLNSIVKEVSHYPLPDQTALQSLFKSLI